MIENATIHSFGNIFEIGNDVPTSLDVMGFPSESLAGYIHIVSGHIQVIDVYKGSNLLQKKTEKLNTTNNNWKKQFIRIKQVTKYTI